MTTREHSREEASSAPSSSLIHLESPNGRLRVTLTTFGAAIFAVEVPDGTGRMGDIALGCDTLEDFKMNPFAYGATCGRVANRIANAKFALDGVEYPLARNNGPNCLHGSDAPFHGKEWELGAIDRREGGNSAVTFHLTSPDGDGGFPGELKVSARYALRGEDELTLEYRATTTKPTVINLTNHVYWNLSSHYGATVDDHVLTMPASKFLPIDEDHLVLGELRDVEGTPFDLRNGALIGERLASRDPQIDPMRGFDHAMVVDGEGFRPGARLEHAGSGRWLEMSTDQAAIHVYSGGFLSDAVPGRKGSRIGPYSAIALESENFPDAPNRPEFPDCVLRPGGEYLHRISWRFGSRVSR